MSFRNNFFSSNFRLKWSSQTLSLNVKRIYLNRELEELLITLQSFKRKKKTKILKGWTMSTVLLIVRFEDLNVH